MAAKVMPRRLRSAGYTYTWKTQQTRHYKAKEASTVTTRVGSTRKEEGSNESPISVVRDQTLSDGHQSRSCRFGWMLLASAMRASRKAEAWFFGGRDDKATTRCWRPVDLRRSARRLQGGAGWPTS